MCGYLEMLRSLLRGMLHYRFGKALVIATACAGVTIYPAQSLAVEEDAGGWLAAFATKSIDQHWIAYMEGQLRYGDDIGRLSQTLWRPGIGYRLSPELSIWGGYAYITTARVGADDTQEHRVWQQILWNAGEVFGAKVISRTRLEQRFVDPGDDTGWRFRQFVRMVKPLENWSGLDAVGYLEGFFHINDTDWGAESGLDQTRLFAGLGREIASGIRLEGGYLNQYINSSRGDNRMNHILSLNLFLNF